MFQTSRLKFYFLKFKKKLRCFIWPIYPVKPFQAVQFIVLLGMLLAIQLVLRRLIIPIPAFRTQISFIWMPVMIAGWFFGMFYGFIFGWISDTLGFLMGGGVWFWLYAIQEPIIGLFAGIIGSIVRLLRTQIKIWVHLVINQLILVTFTAISLGYVINWYQNQNQSFKLRWFSQTFYAIVLGFIVAYFVAIEVILLIFIKKKRTSLITYMYASIVVTSMILLWSFILGPYSAIAYYKYVNGGRIPANIIKYGPIYYLIPRIIREMIKTPLQSIVLTGIILAISPIFNNIYSLLANSYLHDHAVPDRRFLCLRKRKQSDIN